jgi:hypothetical protein
MRDLNKKGLDSETLLADIEQDRQDCRLWPHKLRPGILPILFYLLRLRVCGGKKA